LCDVGELEDPIVTEFSISLLVFILVEPIPTPASPTKSEDEVTVAPTPDIGVNFS